MCVRVGVSVFVSVWVSVSECVCVVRVCDCVGMCACDV